MEKDRLAAATQARGNSDRDRGAIGTEAIGIKAIGTETGGPSCRRDGATSAALAIAGSIIAICTIAIVAFRTTSGISVRKIGAKWLHPSALSPARAGGGQSTKQRVKKKAEANATTN